MSDWVNIAVERAHDEVIVEPGSAMERRARLTMPLHGRCPHGFEDGSGLCRIRGCSAFGDVSKIRTCSSCKLPYSSEATGRGMCPKCELVPRKHRRTR